MKDALFWTGSGFGKGRGQGGPWDLTDPDETQELDMTEWLKGVMEDLEREEKARVKKQCVCGGAATKDYNLHAFYCPAYRPSR